MPEGRNTFIDPAGARPDYDWAINHSEEGEFGKARNIEHGANTANTGFVRQQSDAGPLTISVTGTILAKAQVQEMIAWFNLCETQTIYFTDFAGDQYEVTITSFKPTRHRTIRNPRDFANAPYWFWRYEMTMDVVRVIDSVWEGVVS